jgi:hypothetical protein
MVDVAIAGGKLVLKVESWDQLWAFKSSLEIPLQHIEGVRRDPQIARKWWQGIRVLGTHVPGVITAGRFYHEGKRVFWDVHNPENAIVISLHDERFDQLVVEVGDPELAVKQIEDAAGGHRTSAPA